MKIHHFTESIAEFACDSEKEYILEKRVIFAILAAIKKILFSSFHTMKKILSLVAAAGLLFLFGCAKS